MQIPTFLFIPFLIPVYLLPLYTAVAGPLPPRPLIRQVLSVAASPTPFPTATTNVTTAGTYNYWWPYPPATTTVTVLPPIGAAQDQLTLPPTPLPTADETPSETLSIPSSPPTSPTPSATTSTTSTTGSPTASTSSPLTNNANSQESSTKKKLNTLYLIPFSIIALLALLGTCWLIHGCCTRKPKYHPRPSLHLHSSYGYGPTGISEYAPPPPKNDKRKDREMGMGPQATQVTFKALRYEDLSVDRGGEADGDGDRGRQYGLDDPVWGSSADAGTLGRGCQHTREFGFECDCRLSVIEGEGMRNQFRWPRTRLEDIPDDEGGCEAPTPRARAPAKEEAKEAIYTPNHVPGRSRTDRSSGSGASGPSEFTPLEILSDTCSEPHLTPEHDPAGKGKARSGYFDTKEGVPEIIGRQGKLLESVLLQDRQRGRVPRRSPTTTTTTKKTRKLSKSTKSVKSAKSARTARSAYSDEGFRLIAESPLTLSSDGRSGPSRESVRDVGEGWVGKMTSALGSSFSRLSGGSKDEDKYTPLPEPSNHHHHRTRSPPNKRRRDKDHAQSPCRSTSSKLSHQAVQALKGYRASRARRDAVGMNGEERRLQSHRESIASLPAGMVYSPPLVGVSVFEDEDEGLGSSASCATVRGAR